MTDTATIARKKLKIPANRLASINKILLDPKNSSVNGIFLFHLSFDFVKALRSLGLTHD